MSAEKGLKLKGKKFEIIMLITSNVIAYFQPEVQKTPCVKYGIFLCVSFKD